MLRLVPTLLTLTLLAATAASAAATEGAGLLRGSSGAGGDNDKQNAGVKAGAGAVIFQGDDGALPTRPVEEARGKQGPVGVVNVTGEYRSTEGRCVWTFDRLIGDSSVYVDTVYAYKDHESATVTLKAYGGSGHCNDPDAPTYIGSIQIEVDYDGGWMRTAETRLTDLKHDGGLSAFNWEFVDTFHNMYNFDPNEDCGTVQVTISNDLCG